MMACPTVPPDLAPVVARVAEEFQRLESSGFVRDLNLLNRRRGELPMIVRECFGIFGLQSSAWWDKVKLLVEAAALLGPKPLRKNP